MRPVRPRSVLVAVPLLYLLVAAPASAQEVLVISDVDGIVELLEAEDWWQVEGEPLLAVPHIILTGIEPAWSVDAQNMPVQWKKEIFYRLMLPLVVHANAMVLERRGVLLEIQESLDAGLAIPPNTMDRLRDDLVRLRVLGEDEAAALGSDPETLGPVLDNALYRVDVIPNGLALGQAAYESGYGTSRFATQGNALFGQWTYDGSGIKPEHQRTELGDHRIAAFEWPFDSMRGYFLNLMSHPAYEEFRRLRAESRAQGRPLSSLALADGLTRYSERGQDYVDDLKAIIRVNNLEAADGAVFRDEEIRFLVGTRGDEAAAELRAEIERLRASDELAQIIERMRLR